MISLIADLVRAGVDASLVARVADELANARAALDAIESRRAADRARQATKRSRDITLRHVSHVTGPPPNDYQSNPPLQPHPVNDKSLTSLPADAELPIELPRIDRLKKAKELTLVGEWWNGLASKHSLPQIDEIRPNSKIERSAVKLTKILQTNFQTLDDGLKDLERALCASDYLMGRVNGFRCTFPWLTNPDNYDKIKGGAYENRKAENYGHRAR